MTKTVAALFDSSTEAQQVIHDLLAYGVPRHEISLIIPHPEGQAAAKREQEAAKEVKVHEAEEHVGLEAVLGGVGGLLVSLSTLVIPGFGPLIAIGPLAVALAGTLAGAYAGEIVGPMIHLGVAEEAARHYAEGLRRGGALVVIKLPDEMANQAEAIVNRHHPVSLEAHESQART
jgi:uncharacterized membrane protein